ncbi:hypothetical protein MTZ49_01625 [Entomomonas sp. E2T0]|uniref:hypothetical protein n=1 Tax=Entomomonas sp. E2T0 TaxID=2930213 RepID=UPI0022284055|nr:hypothetical protein [Entomomonas sp. E2T0]UYZ84307.1 hypothetical protein MTZ49_01625 [Entomomonas sp. E2T0]
MNEFKFNTLVTLLLVILLNQYVASNNLVIASLTAILVIASGCAGLYFYFKGK